VELCLRVLVVAIHRVVYRRHEEEGDDQTHLDDDERLLEVEHSRMRVGGTVRFVSVVVVCASVAEASRHRSEVGGGEIFNYVWRDI